MFGIQKKLKASLVESVAGWKIDQAVDILMWFEKINGRPEYAKAREEFMAAIASVDRMTAVDRAKAEILRLQGIVDAGGHATERTKP